MKQKIKVLHSLFRVGSGGVEQTRLSLARNLDASRYEQRVVCLDAFGSLPAALRSAGCAVDKVGNGNSIFGITGYRHALGIIHEWRPDIIHGAVYEGVAIAAVAGRLGRVPVIIGEETSDPVSRSAAGHALYRMFAAMTDRMVAVSPAVSEYLTRTIRIPASKVSMIMNGVEEPAPRDPLVVQAIRNKYGIGDQTFVVGTVGRLEDSCKRVSDLIRAMPMLREAGRDARLLVVGEGEDSEMLRGLAESLGVADSVHFCGYQATAADYYAVMDVFALASAHEAFGLVLVEAMYAEVPVVATRVGGIPSVVDDGVTGLLVEALSPTLLATAILTLHADDGLRQSMGRKGRQRALAEFGADRYVRQVDTLYTELLARNNAH